MTDRTRHRVLIIGAGRRVKNNFLPSLRCLADRFEIVGVHARTAERLDPLCALWTVPPVHRLDDVDFTAVDVVVISVPTAQNANVLRQVVARAPGATIVIDTPIAWSLAEFAETRPLLARFGRVVVTEDYMNFPPFALARQAVAGGLIGSPRAVTLTNIGFFYHGLALIRSFYGFARVVGARASAIGARATVVRYSFGEGRTGFVIGPYRKSAGSFVIEGASGSISDATGDKGEPGKPVHALSLVRGSDGVIAGVELRQGGAAGDVLLSLDLPQIAKMAAMPVDDRSDLNLLRGCGLMTVFQSVVEADPLNEAYGPGNATYDAFVSRAATKGWLRRDPLRWFGGDIMHAIRLIAAVRQRQAR